VVDVLEVVGVTARVDPRVEAVKKEYQARSDREASIGARLQAANSRENIDDLLLAIGPATATIVTTLIEECEARAILEVGTSYGYSTVWLAEAARATGGIVTTLELHANKVEYARAQIAKAGLAEFVDFRVGDALQTLKELPGPFDFVLLDLWKDLYIPCFDLIHPKLANGALIVADNMLHPERARRDANLYRARARAAEGITSVLLPVGHGIELSRYR
jgi:predicted O-methyltransferase YrrM